MKETPIAAAAFEEYYDLGDDRTLLQLAKNRRQRLLQNNQDTTKKLPTEATLLANLKKWSVEHGWQERIKSRDRERAEAKRKKKDAEIEEMDKRHVQIGTSLQLKGLKQADKLLQKEEVSAAESLRMIKIGTDLERVARGEPTEISQTKDDKEEYAGIITIDTRNLSVERLAKLRAFALQMKKDEETD